MKKKHLSDTELTLLLSALRDARNGKHVTIGRHTALLLETMIRTGIRGNELFRLTVADLDPLNSLIHVRDPAKGSDARACYLPPEIVTGLVEAVAKKKLEPGDLLTRIISWEGQALVAGRRTLERKWERLRAELFGPGFDLGLHSLRHTAAHVVLSTGSSLSLLQNFLGHKSIQTTAIYVAIFSPEQVNAVVRGTVLGSV